MATTAYTLNPTSNTSPDPGQGGSAVTSPINTGHASTTAARTGSGSQSKSCLWTSFSPSPAFNGIIISIVLKVDYTQDGFLTDGGVFTSNQFTIDYSLNGGASYSSLRLAGQIQSLSSGTDQVTLSSTQDITQIRVRDDLLASGAVGETASVTTSISNIRVELLVQDPQVIVIM